MTVVNPATQGTLGIFISAETDSDAAEQSIAHSLGRTPTAVVVCVTDNNSGADMVVTEGTHTSTYVKISVVGTSIKYKVVAM